MNMSNYTQHLRSKYIYFTISHNIYQSLLFLTRRSHPAQPWRRPLMVRQPYSAAVLSTGGRLHPSRLRREGLVRMWSSLWLKGDGGIRKTFFNGKEGRVGFRKNSFWLKGGRGFRKRIPSNHPITYQRYEKRNRHTPSCIRNMPHDYWSNRTTHYRHDKQGRG